jgi:hypothetical protein
MKKKRLGEVLYERGQISAADLKRALLDQQGRVIHLGELLLERKLVTKQDLLDRPSPRFPASSIWTVPHSILPRTSCD